MDNEWKQTPVRLSGAKSPAPVRLGASSPAKPSILWHDRFINAVMGFVFASAMVILATLLPAILWIQFTLVGALVVALVAVDFWIGRTIKPGFQFHAGWIAVGGVLSLMTVMPAIGFPDCRFGNKCPATHQVLQVHHGR